MDQKTNEHDTEEYPKKQKIISLGTLLASLGWIAFLIVIATISIAYALPQSPEARNIDRFLPLPVVMADMTHVVTASSWQANIASVERYYAAHKDEFLKNGIVIDFSSPDGRQLLLVKQKEILSKMIEDQLVISIARDQGIVISDTDLANNVDKKLQEYGSRDAVVGRLSREYGWSLDDFKRIIVEPSLYSEALEKKYVAERKDNGQAKKKIQEAQAELTQRVSFADVVSKYSEGSTVDNGGDLGWLSIDTLTPEIATVVKTIPLQTPSDIIESDMGYHIVSIDERKQENGTDFVHLRQILVRRQTYPDWLVDQEKTRHVWVLLHGFVWNQNMAHLEFSDPDLRHFEENAKQDASGVIL